MILEEGGARIENTVLFGKYRICRVIGTGRRGTVFLAVHERLEEYRAIKRVSKVFVDYQQFRREGLILKGLRHPGIPIIYDLEEDESYCYLIEEYLEGDSLYDLVKNSGHLSETAVIRYGIEICRIVNYLHSAGKIPILHLDLQPKNLLLCHETIKLIDFDHAATVDEANLTGLRYGTVGCAAPEQYTTQTLDERTDIYAIGVLLHYLRFGCYPGECIQRWKNRRLGTAVKTCLNKDRTRRHPSADYLLKALELASGCNADVFEQDQLSSLTIALVSSKSGTGTTHLAIGFCTFLHSLGISCLYEEKNSSKAVLALGEYFNQQPDETGILTVCGCEMKPDYGASVKLHDVFSGVRILDFGTDLQAMLCKGQLNAVLLTGGGMWWEREALKKALTVLEDVENLIVVLPCSLKEHEYKMLSQVKKYTCFLVPCFPNPFKITSQADSFFRDVLKEIADWKGDGGTSWFLKKFEKFRRTIGRR